MSKIEDLIRATITFSAALNHLGVQTPAVVVMRSFSDWTELATAASALNADGAFFVDGKHGFMINGIKFVPSQEGA